jgi:hypothetical protein
MFRLSLWRSLWGLLWLCGCMPPRIDPDIVRPAPGAPLLTSIPGSLLGAFDSYNEALFATCQRILEKPHSSAGRQPSDLALREEQDAFKLRWRISTEYCAWMYYTPDGKYVVSKLTDQTKPQPSDERKRCFLPSAVDDPRFPPGSIKYIFVVHNHPNDTPISKDDVIYIVAQGLKHGFNIQTKDGNLRLSIIAFFSNSHANPTCDGLYIYSPEAGRILKYTRNQSQWRCEQTHIVEWLWDKGEGQDWLAPTITEAKAACPSKEAP